MWLKRSCVIIYWHLHLHKIIYKLKIMKNLFLICLFLSVIFIPQISYSSTSVTSGDVKKDIDLKGSLADATIRSVFEAPIQATISPSSLDVVFLSNVGDIEVEVYAASGSLVYENNVDTQMQENLSIDVFGWASGTYQIRFVSSTGQYMYGIFEIE